MIVEAPGPHPFAQAQHVEGVAGIAYDSLMTHGADPRDALDVLRLRERMRAWRFYDHFSAALGEDVGPPDDRPVPDALGLDLGIVGEERAGNCPPTTA
jgi:predicted ATPase